LKIYAWRGIKALFQGKLELVNLIIHYTVIPKAPMVMSLSLGLAFSWYFGGLYLLWFLCLLGFSLSMLLAVPKSFYNKRSLKALIKLPLTMYYMILATIGALKCGSKQDFEKTEKRL
jgi:hypothetical protein